MKQEGSNPDLCDNEILAPEVTRNVLEEQEQEIAQLEAIPQNDYYAVLNISKKVG
jgi:hypothetical protein